MVAPERSNGLAAGPVLEARNVSKTFDGTIRALQNVSVTINEGEIVGVLGENGAGKSTLMKILGGVYPPDEGTWIYRGQEEPFPTDPAEAAERGIAVVHQERGIVPALKVFEYLFLGHEELKHAGARIMDAAAMREQSAALLDEFGIDVDADAFLYDVPPAAQKMIEIARAVALIRRKKSSPERYPIVILDEPTAPLSPEERELLFGYLERLKARSSFVLVTHNLGEVIRLCDRVYVLRDGQEVAAYSIQEDQVTERDLITAVAGAKASEILAEPGSTCPPDAEVILEVRNLSRARAYTDISFQLREGECVGLYGPKGCGKAEVLRTLAGLLPFDEGSLLIQGQAARASEGVPTRLRKGVGYFTGEFERELFFNLPVAANVSIINMSKIAQRLGFLNLRHEQEMAHRVIERLRVKAAHPRGSCRPLSGGNKQKVSLGRWLERRPKILLLENPTIGVDVGWGCPRREAGHQRPPAGSGAGGLRAGQQ
ncbi:MAG: sugar ABC transporter ATP-binding protein, partial [Firmicutes bacterium]|nr:sugar ABC transporter ATP-binding protein [Bacillota bacterium]